MTQIEIKNNTPYRRRIFLHASQLTVKEPIPLALTAWKFFDLAPGACIGTVDGDFQVAARVSHIMRSASS